MKKIRIEVADLSLSAELSDTPTARKIMNSLPLESSANVWGEEIYFNVPLQLETEADAREEVEVGDLGYWPAGPAVCIFFGPTPVSTGNKPKAYSPVNIFGRVLDDATRLKGVASGAQIRVTTVED